MRPYRANLSLRRLAKSPSISVRAIRTRSARSTDVDASSSSSSFSAGKQYRTRVSQWHDYNSQSQSASTVAPAVNPLNYIELQAQAKRRNTVYNKRLAWYGAGILACVVAQTIIIFYWDDELKGDAAVAETTTNTSSSSSRRQVERLDAGKEGAKDFEGRDIKVIEKPGLPGVLLDAVTGIEMVETGTSSIPHFPRLITLPHDSGEEEYTLLGLGIRTVSFLSIQVYVLGYYVRTTDLPALQAEFVKHINPIGTSLIPQEKESLKEQLLDAQKSTEVWSKVLREAGARSAVRIIPTRGTDFAHLRDGWVRGITARTQDAQKQGSHDYEDETFGAAVKEFKAVFGGRGKAPKGSTVILMRDERGSLSAVYEHEVQKNAGAVQEKKASRESLGVVQDERISRLVWLGYLAGKNPSSEAARQSIVNGVIELVERPVGTVGLAVT